MTYIIAGKLKGNNFMMADCIATDKTKTPERYTFAEKIKGLLSDPGTYFSMAGKGNIAHYIEFYDYWIYSQNQKSDFVNDISSLNSLIRFIVLANSKSTIGKIDLGDNRLFFLNKQGVFFCHITFNTDDTLQKEPVIRNVAEGYYIDSNFGSLYNPIGKKAESIEKENIRDYCLQELKYLARGDGDRETLFTSRIQFIMFGSDGNNITESALKYPSDMLSYYFNKDYIDLDNPDFQFSV